MTLTDNVRAIYQHLDQADLDALLALLAPDAKIFVPGTTRISGDHEADARRTTLQLITTTPVRRTILDVIGGANAIDVIMNETVTRDGTGYGYHALHQFEIRDSQLAYWWWYIHEYDQFDLAWR